MESHVRSLAKALTWRLGGLVITTGVVWVFTRRASLAAGIALGDTMIKLFAFYAHERVWLKINFGRHRPPEYEI